MTSCRKCLNGALAKESLPWGRSLLHRRGDVGISHQRSLPTKMIVNLNRYRKKRRRAEAEAQAKENRVRFGLSKEERARELRERQREAKEIENKRLE